MVYASSYFTENHVKSQNTLMQPECKFLDRQHLQKELLNLLGFLDVVLFKEGINLSLKAPVGCGVAQSQPMCSSFLEILVRLEIAQKMKIPFISKT